MSNGIRTLGVRVDADSLLLSLMSTGTGVRHNKQSLQSPRINGAGRAQLSLLLVRPKKIAGTVTHQGRNVGSLNVENLRPLQPV
jgi:hypothetical protein